MRDSRAPPKHDVLPGYGVQQNIATSRRRLRLEPNIVRPTATRTSTSMLLPGMTSEQYLASLAATPVRRSTAVEMPVVTCVTSRSRTMEGLLCSRDSAHLCPTQQTRRQRRV